ncbi:MAG: hypothetical protein LBQ42_13455 [Synergistaceae bacterium]|nr:hypothetical protein [Synergistaceae bacterium]
MSDKFLAPPGNPSDSSDPLVETREKLEALRSQLADDMESKKVEFERFKEETLWRLNAMSDRTIEIVRMEAKNVEDRLARDRERLETELAAWKKNLYQRLHDEKFLDVLAKDAFDHLFPSFEELKEEIDEEINEEITGPPEDSKNVPVLADTPRNGGGIS